MSFFYLPFLFVILSPLQSNAEETPRPLRWGFDDIGVQGVNCRNEGCLISHPKADQLLDEFSFNLWITWYPDNASEWGTQRNIDYIRRLDTWCAQRNIDWIANTLSSLWGGAPPQCIDADGFDWYNRPDARHFYLFPEPILAELGRCKRLAGVLYDEAEHHQNNANAVQNVHRPAIYDPTGQTLLDAAEGHTNAAKLLCDLYRKHGVSLYTEQVFPVMFHDFARAGFVAGTKVLKETLPPVYIACAMGAAIQYDKELWISPDLWGVSGYVGHSTDEYRSSLLMAYHLGADCIYTESLALDEGGKGKGSLILMTPTDYSVTEYGRIAKWFINEYAPANPRRYSFRELRPRTAIIRQEDGCWGQRFSPYPWTPDMLFGSKEWTSNETTEAWLKIWSLLTNGEASPNGLSWWCDDNKTRPFQVLWPLDGVAVYDHLVTAKHLKGVEVIFLTGIGVSTETMKAVEDCVRAGAVCVALPHLAPARLRDSKGKTTDGKGSWVVAEDFLDPTVKANVEQVIPKDDCVRYRFEDHQVVLSPISGNRNRIEANVTQE